MYPQLIDFHCHLDLYRDHEALYERYRREKIEILAVTTTPRAWKRNLELATGAANIRVGLGLHPQLIAEGMDELNLFETILHQTRYVGEVGLDASPRFYKSFDTQKRIFERVLRSCSEQGGKILSLHTVRCVGQVLKMLETFLPRGSGKAVLHWFTGSPSEARKAAELGCYFSINSEMLKSDSGRCTVAAIPRDRILTETDGPFTMTDGRPSVPDNVIFTLKYLAASLKCDTETLGRQIILNLRKLEGNEEIPPVPPKQI